MFETVLLIFMTFFVAVLAVAGMGLLKQKQKGTDEVYDSIFRQELKRISPKMYEIISSNSRKMNETEEAQIYDLLKGAVKERYNGPDAFEALKTFKSFLDEHTEKTDYGTPSPQSRRYVSSKQFETNPKNAYSQAQKELFEIENVVVGTRTKFAEEAEKNRHFPDFAYNKELGIDVIEKGPARRMLDAKEKIKKHPYADMSPEEALKIKSNIEDSVSKGLISPEIADKYIKGCEKAAGIKPIYSPTKDELERRENIRRSDEKYFEKVKSKRKEAESYFQGPTKGRAIGDADTDELYRKLAHGEKVHKRVAEKEKYLHEKETGEKEDKGVGGVYQTITRFFSKLRKKK